MDLIQIITLSLVQGLTEFLPISSSAHLILSPYIFGFSDQGLSFDIAVHLGSLLAVMLYFRLEIFRIVQGVFSTTPALAQERQLGWFIVIATIPVVIFGLMMKTLVETDLRSPFVIGITTIIFGLLLWYADSRHKGTKNEHSMTWKNALFIGFFQAIAIIPGTSRSGITITAGLLLGLTRKASTRFSFLLSIPTILMSGGLVTLELIQAETLVNWNELFSGLLISFFAAYFCIHFFLRFIERIGMLPFVIYRLLLGAFIFLVIL